MYFLEDESFARRLQYEEQAYENFKRQKEDKEKENLKLVDSALEYIDPTPSIHDLFVRFDKKFFWSKLGMVQVAWSNKMTRCAGVCSFESRGGLCKIALSSPLLSLRPRKDLVETLLHEMIHAYLFVTRNFKDREDHGPEFHKHMFRINKEAGTHITVYHTFNDEVEYYQKHVWRCNGPCQYKKPYFGVLRRAMNRPPGPRDPWWSQHKAECGGTYIKISEPEKPVKKTKKIIAKPEGRFKDIRDYFKQSGISNKDVANKSSNIKTLADIKARPGTGMKMNTGTGTIVVTNVNKERKSVNESSSQNPVKTTPKNTTGLKQNSGKDKSNFNQMGIGDSDVRETVRKVWADKFKTTKPPDDPEPKKAKLKCPMCDEGFSEDEIEKHVDKCLQTSTCDTNNEDSNAETSTCSKEDDYRDCPVCSEKILHSEMDDHLEGCINCSFVNEEGVEFENEILCESVPCPCCYKWFNESEMNSHIDECLTLSTLRGEISA